MTNTVQEGFRAAQSSTRGSKAVKK